MRPDPLSGKRILVTRAAEQQETTIESIRSHGAEPISFPCLELQCMPDAIRAVLGNSDDYSDVLFTSANGVHCVAEALGDGGLTELLASRRLAAVGRKTAAALQQHGLVADMLPSDASQKGLLTTYREHGLPRHLLFFRAEEGSELLGDELGHLGCRVTLTPAYRMRCPGEDAGEICRMLAEDRIDAVLLASPRTAIHYVQRIGDAALADRPAVAVISEQVAAAARKAGLHVQVVAEDASFDSMLSALAGYFSQVHP